MTEKTDLREQDEKVVEIEMERLVPFNNRPFKVILDNQMKELQDSIKKYGIPSLQASIHILWRSIIRIFLKCRR